MFCHPSTMLFFLHVQLAARLRVRDRRALPICGRRTLRWSNPPKNRYAQLVDFEKTSARKPRKEGSRTGFCSVALKCVSPSLSSNRAKTETMLHPDLTKNLCHNSVKMGLHTDHQKFRIRACLSDSDCSIRRYPLSGQIWTGSVRGTYTSSIYACSLPTC